jgi:hypothetical protein
MSTEPICVFLGLSRALVIISVYTINLSGSYNRGVVCSLCGTRCVFKCNSLLIFGGLLGIFRQIPL